MDLPLRNGVITRAALRPDLCVDYRGPIAAKRLAAEQPVLRPGFRGYSYHGA